MKARLIAAFAAIYLVNPVVALVLAWMVGDESPSGRALIAAILVIGAVLLTWNPSPGGNHEPSE